MDIESGARPIETHAWHIDEREYARHELRRGRRFAFTVLDPRRTALVVIDMVPFHVNENPYCRGTVPHINELADALRGAGGLVAWVVPARHEPTARQIEFFGPRTAEIYSASAGSGPLPTRVWHELNVRDDDLFVEKSAYSAFFPGRCDLARLLAERDIDTVLITGTVTDVCCESSARDASTLGFRVIMVADANAAPRDSVHNATLRTIYRSFGDVRPTSEVVHLIAADSAPDSDSVPARPIDQG